MKKHLRQRTINLGLIVVLLLLVSSSVILAVTNARNIVEEYDATSYNTSFTINNNQYYYDAGTNSTFSFTVQNASDLSKSFDLLVFTSSSSINATTNIGGTYYKTVTSNETVGEYTNVTSLSPVINNNKVLLVNYSLNVSGSVSINVTFTESVKAKFVVVTSSIYNRYIKDEVELMLLDNDYRHFIENNDSNVDIIIDYEVASGVNDTNYQDYYLLKDGKYVWGDSEGYANTNTYYQKTYTYNDVYNKNAFKNIFVMNDMNIQGELNNGAYYSLLNLPCNLHLMYSNVTLNANLEIKHYYKGIYYIDTLGGIIDNSVNTMSIVTMNGYYTCSNVYNTPANYSILTSVDVDIPSNASVVLNDATSLIRNILKTNAYLGKDMTILVDDTNLPLTFNGLAEYDYVLYQTSLSEGEYVKTSTISDALSELGSITRATTNQVYCLTTTISVGDNTTSFDSYLMIVGTDNQEKLKAYVNELSYYIQQSYEQDVLTKDIFIGDTTNQTSIAYKYYPDETVDYTVDPELSLTAVTGGLLLSTNTYTTGVYNMVVSDGVNSENISVNVNGLSIFEKTNFISRYIPSFSLSNIDSSKEFVTIYDNNVAKTNANNIRYTLWIYDGTTYRELQAYSIENPDGYYTISAVLEHPEKVEFAMVKGLTLSGGEKLFLKTEICYDTETFEDALWSDSEEASMRSFYREIFIPRGGLGGTGDPSYIGNIFQQYFNDHAETISSDGTYKFSTNDLFFKMEVDYVRMGIIDDRDVLDEDELNKLHEYFNFYAVGDYTSSSHDYYCYYTIDPNLVPVYDTTIYISVTIVDNIDKFGTVDEYVQDYSFLIPGVYQTPRDITDPTLYDYLISVYGDSYTTGDVRNDYLLVREAQKTRLLLDLSKNTVATALGANVNDYTNLSLRGLSYLTKTEEIVLDGWTIDNVRYLIVDDLANNEENYTLTSLQLIGCDIGTADFSDFKMLTTLDISDNDFVNVPQIYRSVKTLNLSNNQINTIEGVNEYVGIETIYLSNNRIKTFYPLTALITENLKKVYVDRNTTIGNEDYYKVMTIGNSSILMYGSQGEINKPTYLTLIDNNVRVYNDYVAGVYSEFIITNDITDVDQYEDDQDLKIALVAINSIIIYDKNNDSFVVDRKVGNIDLSVAYVSVTHTITNTSMTIGTSTINTYTITPTPVVTDFKVILGLTTNGITVYREFYIKLGGITL